MATPKKNSSESETARAEEFAAAAQKLARTHKPVTSEVAASPEQKKSAQKSSAATHKAPARKTVKSASVSEPVESVLVESSAFDVAQHNEEISKEAYHHWLRNGCPQGSEHQDWLAAIETVRARYQK